MIRPVKLGDAIAEHLERLILEGVLRPGEKLAAERELAEKLDVSRPSLREAIEKLHAKGLLTTSKSGTVVADFLASLARPLGEVFADKPRVTADYFEYRRMIEGQAAGMAATRATDVDRAGLAQCVERLRAAHAMEDPSEEAAADADLHLLVYEAAHNVVLLHVMRVFGQLMRREVFFSRSKLYRRFGVRDVLLAQHLAITEAILRGDPGASEKAASEHVRYTFETIEEIRRDEDRIQVSLRRVSRASLLASE